MERLVMTEIARLVDVQTAPVLFPWPAGWIKSATTVELERLGAKMYSVCPAHWLTLFNVSNMNLK